MLHNYDPKKCHKIGQNCTAPKMFRLIRVCITTSGSIKILEVFWWAMAKSSLKKTDLDAAFQAFCVKKLRSTGLQNNWQALLRFYFIYFIFYVYPPDSQESNAGINTQDKPSPRPASGDAKILLSG